MRQSSPHKPLSAAHASPDDFAYRGVTRIQRSKPSLRQDV